VRNPNEYDWDELVRLMQFLNHTKNDRLNLEADEFMVSNWHVDA